MLIAQVTGAAVLIAAAAAAHVPLRPGPGRGAGRRSGARSGILSGGGS